MAMSRSSSWLHRPTLGLLAVLAIFGCRRGEPGGKTRQEESPASSCSSRAHESQLRPPTQVVADRAFELVTLPLTTYGPATIAVPRGATEPRPLVVALHAHAIRPEHACERWFRATGSVAYVLCPHGLPRDAKADAKVTLGDAVYTEREIASGIGALRSRFGNAVVTDSPLLVGWSHGAMIGAMLVARAPMAFGHLVFGEGGYEQMTDAVLGDWGKRAHRRVLLLCSTKPCEVTYAAVRRRCERRGLDCRVEGTGGHKHPFDGDVVSMATRAFAWLDAEDSRLKPRALP